MLAVALGDKFFEDQAIQQKTKFNTHAPTNGLEICAVFQLKRSTYSLDKLKKIVQKKMVAMSIKYSFKDLLKYAGYQSNIVKSIIPHDKSDYK